MTDLDEYVRSLVLWMLGIAAASYGGKVAWRFVPRGLKELAGGWFRVPIGFELLLVGLATLLVVMEPVHWADGLGAQDVLNRWEARLPYVAGAALVAAFLSGLLDRAGPVGAGLALAWPSGFYAAMAWVFYLWLRSFIPTEDMGRLAELVGYATPFLTLVTAYPGAAFVCGVAGAIVGRLQAR
jgi:hypothetical protein